MAKPEHVEIVEQGAEAKEGAVDWRRIRTRFDLARLFLGRYLRALPDGALSKGGHVIGILPRFMQELEWGHSELPELRVVIPR